MHSDSGFPAGDPLSIFAMLTVNWGYHVYTNVFTPRVQAYSVADYLLRHACIQRDVWTMTKHMFGASQPPCGRHYCNSDSHVSMMRVNLELP